MENTFHTILITRHPEAAAAAQQSGVGRILVDLELKADRLKRDPQAFAMAAHIEAVHKATGGTLPLIARINPLHPRSQEEISDAITAGASHIMLPMITYADDIRRASEMIAGKAALIALIETPQALARLHEITRMEEVEEYYLGLHDLQTGMGLDSVFDLYGGRLLEWACAQLAETGKSYGLGALPALAQEPELAPLLLAEMQRLGSRAAILTHGFLPPQPKEADIAAAQEAVAAITDEYARLCTRTPEEKIQDRYALEQAIYKLNTSYGG